MSWLQFTYIGICKNIVRLSVGKYLAETKKMELKLGAQTWLIFFALCFLPLKAPPAMLTVHLLFSLWLKEMSFIVLNGTYSFINVTTDGEPKLIERPILSIRKGQNLCLPMLIFHKILLLFPKRGWKSLYCACLDPETDFMNGETNTEQGELISLSSQLFFLCPIFMLLGLRR